jgi:hypothetical protein
VRDRLAGTILAALHDAGARETLAGLARGEAAASGWLLPGEERLAEVVTERARMATAALAGRPLAPAPGSLAETLDAAAMLFDARLYFEVHELLEPSWQGAAGEPREALQGLIQVAVGYQHLANGNLDGGRALLVEGASRLVARRVATVDVEPFARAVLAAVAGGSPERASVPRFPRASA